MLANRCCFRSQEIFLLIALGVSVDARALVETIIIVHSTIATRCLNEDLVDDLRMQLRGRRHDRREGVVDVVVGDDVVVQFVQYCRQITRRGLACKHHSSFTESHLRIFKLGIGKVFFGNSHGRFSARHDTLKLTNQSERFFLALRFGFSMNFPVVEVLADFQVARQRSRGVVQIRALLQVPHEGLVRLPHFHLPGRLHFSLAASPRLRFASFVLGASLAAGAAAVAPLCWAAGRLDDGWLNLQLPIHIADDSLVDLLVLFGLVFHAHGDLLDGLFALLDTRGLPARASIRPFVGLSRRISPSMLAIFRRRPPVLRFRVDFWRLFHFAAFFTSLELLFL